MDPAPRIELTVRLWRGGSKRQFERYIGRLMKLLPRHGGRSERRARQVDAGPGHPDAVLVLSFPDTAAVDAYLSDPRRDDLEDLAAKAVTKSLITGGRWHGADEHESAEVTQLGAAEHQPAEVTQLDADDHARRTRPNEAEHEPAEVTQLPLPPG